MELEFSKKSHRLEKADYSMRRKFQSIQWSTGQFATIWKSTNFRRDERSSFLNAENDMRIKLTNLRIFGSITTSI